MFHRCTAAVLVAMSLSLLPVYAQPPVSPAPRIPGMVEVPRLKVQIRDFVVVTAVLPGSPAEKAGLKVGDVVVGIGRQYVTTAEAFTQAVRVKAQKHVLSLDARRSNRVVNCSITLDEWDAAKAPADQPADKRGRIGLATRTFIITQKSDANGAGRKLGLVQGEQIIATHRGQVTAAADFAKAVADTPATQPVYVLFKRAGENVASRLSPDGSASNVAEDLVWAGVANASAVSELIQEASTDIVGFRNRYTGKKVRVAGIVDQVVAHPSDKSLSVQVARLRSADVVWANVKAGPLADRLRQAKPGDVLAFAGTLTSALRKEEVAPSSDDFLDTPAGKLDKAPTEKKVVVKLDFSVEEVL